MATQTRMTLEEFLRLPETEPPSEFVAGEVIQKVAPTWVHGALVAHLAHRFKEYLGRTHEAHVSLETRHAARDQDRVYLPDLNVTLSGRLPRGQALRRGPVEVAPDIAVEVLSPEDRAGYLLDRVDFYLRAGVQLAWFIDPERETLTVYRKGQEPRVFHRGETVDAGPVLADFHLDLEDLFGSLPD